MKLNKLSVFLFHPTIQYKGELFVKPHHGKFIDEISTNFHKVFLIAPFIKERNFPEWLVVDGKPIYDYQFKNKKVFLVKSFYQKLLYPLRFFLYIYYLVISNRLLFFVPSVSLVVMFPFLFLLRKKYFCYVASEPSTFFDSKIESRFFAGFLNKIFSLALSHSNGILATGNRNFSRWKNKTNVLRVNPLLNFDFENIIVHQMLEKDEDSFIFAGAITPNKRVMKIVETIALIKKNKPNVYLDIVGNYSEENYSYFEQIISYIQKNNLKENVQLHGYIHDTEHLSFLYKKAKFLILVSEYEGFPKVIWEAMAHQCVPILSNLPSFKGILVANENCFFVENDIEEEICKVIMETPQEVFRNIIMNNMKFVQNMIQTKPSTQFLQLLNFK